MFMASLMRTGTTADADAATKMALLLLIRYLITRMPMIITPTLLTMRSDDIAALSFGQCLLSFCFHAIFQRSVLVKKKAVQRSSSL
jgi:hypothetical protein